MDEYDMQDLYSWIDELPLSRPKRHIARDFSDGVLAAEIVNHFAPRLVELHNYQPANSVKMKMTNWNTLNNKVFKKIGLHVPTNVMQGVAEQKPGVIEVVLNNLRLKLQQYLAPPSTGSHISARQDAYSDGSAAEESPPPPPPKPPKGANRRRDRGAPLPPLGTSRMHNATTSAPTTTRVHPREARAVHRAGSGSGRRAGGYYDNALVTTSPGSRGPPPATGVGRGGVAGHHDTSHGADYEEVVAELEACRAEMSIMQIKIDKLTRLVHLKDKRIEDLQRSIRDQ